MSELLGKMLRKRGKMTASMLNPGKGVSVKGTSFSLSASLRPQARMASMKTCLSVKKPDVSVLKPAEMSSFTKHASDKYSGGSKLMHMQRTSSAASKQPAKPIDMPLPGGSSAAPAPTGTPIAPLEPITSRPQTLSAPKSSPIPDMPMGHGVAFPPASERKQVRFEKSDGPSDFERRIMAAKKAKQTAAAAKAAANNAPRVIRSQKVEMPTGNKADNSVQREMDPLMPAAKHITKDPGSSEKAAPVKAEPVKASKPVVQRETAEPVKAEPVNSDMPVVQREIAEPAKAEMPTVQREMNEPVKAEPLKAAKPLVARDALKSVKAAKPVVQRETAQPVKAEAAKPKKPGIQREIAEPVKAESAAQEMPVVQRETAEPVKAEPVNPDMPVVQREIAEPAKAEPVKAASPVVQREIAESIKAEPVKAASPVVQREIAEPVKAEPVKAASPVVQRETAEPVKAEPASPEMPVVQRETAEPVKAEPVSPKMPVVQRETAEPVKAEPVKAASPVVQRETAEPVKAEPASPVMPVVQRETAEPVKAKPAKVEKSVVQREMAKPVKSDVHETMSMPVVRREPADSANSSALTNIKKSIGSSASASSANKGRTEKTLASWSSKNSMNVPLVQREPADKTAPVQKDEPKPSVPLMGTAKEVVKSIVDLAEGKNSDEAEKKIETAVAEEAGVEITHEQLDALAERLMPRIKRIMRSEMERTSYI